MVALFAAAHLRHWLPATAATAAAAGWLLCADTLLLATLLRFCLGAGYDGGSEHACGDVLRLAHALVDDWKVRLTLSDRAVGDPCRR
jgi:hypothetical protein